MAHLLRLVLLQGTTLTFSTGGACAANFFSYWRKTWFGHTNYL